MQTMWRLPWSSEPGGEKTVADKVGMQKSRQLPVVEIPLLNKLKRKKTDSPEPALPQNARLTKKTKSAHSEAHPVSRIAPVTTTPAATPGSPLVNQANGHVETKPPVKKSPQEEGPSGRDVRQEKEPERTPSDAQSQVQPQKRHDSIQQAAAVSTDNSAISDNLTPLQQVIAAQFSLEILLKHDELRLIEQELAKCQTALEQLRRCQVVPYPGASGPSDVVNSGVGPALQPRSGNTIPQSPAPWGVTDGPYTRHYAKWLLPDPMFDPAPMPTPATVPTGSFEGRATRGGVADPATGSRSRSSRASTVHGPLDTSSPNLCRDPLVLKRSTDGQWVRLFCDICNRGDFSNVQGFLNHCRIAHSQRFETHDAAAIKCGRPVDSNELPALLAAQPVATPTSAVMTGPLVHPLVRPVPPTRAHAPAQRLPARRPNAPPPLTAYPTPSAPANPSFVPSSQTPFLSAELQKRGFSGDLGKMVEDATVKVDLDAIRSSENESDSATDNQQRPYQTKSVKLGAVPTNLQHARAGGMAPAPLDRPLSRKGHRAETPRPVLNFARLPPRLHGSVSSSGSLTQSATPINTFARSSQPPSLQVASSTVVSDRAEIPESPTDQELSPHTVESNPGLVSDHDDDDDEDDAPPEANADSEHPHRVVHRHDEDYDMDDVVEVEDSSDMERAKGINGLEAGGSKKG